MICVRYNIHTLTHNTDTHKKRVKKAMNIKVISTGNHTVFLVQFGINLHEWVFQKAEIARAASASAISAFWKTHKCKLIPNWTRKTVWLLINYTNMKKFAWKKCRKMFLEALFFAFEKIFFRVSVQNFGHCRLFEIIGLQLSQSFCKS